MMRSPMSRHRRNQDIKVRATADADGLPEVCSVPGCGRPTARAAGDGLAVFTCRCHVQFRARHGSLWHRTYRAADLKPYRMAATAWILESRTDDYVAHALVGLGSMLRGAGRVVPASSLRGLSPHRRARIALARLREAEVEPETLLSIHLAISALIEEDPGSHRVTEFRLVQVAKAVHRLASGYHRRWDISYHEGTTSRMELHAYPCSSGRVLRYLGKMIEDRCELVADHHLSAVLDLKKSRFGVHSAIPEPKRRNHHAPNQNSARN